MQKQARKGKEMINIQLITALESGPPGLVPILVLKSSSLVAMKTRFFQHIMQCTQSHCI